MSHNYNHQMNDNDIADQLCLVYQLMRFSRNQKWWWALWLWGLEVSKVNAYMMYRRYHELRGLTPEYSHFEFQEAIGKAWIDPINNWPTRNRMHLSHIERACPTRKIEDFKRCFAITEKALDLKTGKLRCRLDSTLTHFPEYVNVQRKHPTQCQLHMWAFRIHGKKSNSKEQNKPKGSRARVFHCSACNVHLCGKCFNIFHKIDNLFLCIDDILCDP